MVMVLRKNDLVAANWYRQAAEQGLMYAQYNLGLMYDDGDGVEEDKIEAAKWYKKRQIKSFQERNINLENCIEQERGFQRI